MTRKHNKYDNRYYIEKKTMIALLITITTSRPLDTTAPSRFWQYVLPSRISVAFHCKQLDVKGKLKNHRLVSFLQSWHSNMDPFKKSFLSGLVILVYLFYGNVTLGWEECGTNCSKEWVQWFLCLKWSMLQRSRHDKHNIYIYLEPEWPLFWFWLGRFFGRVNVWK